MRNDSDKLYEYEACAWGTGSGEATGREVPFTEYRGENTASEYYCVNYLVLLAGGVFLVIMTAIFLILDHSRMDDMSLILISFIPAAAYIFGLILIRMQFTHYRDVTLTDIQWVVPRLLPSGRMIAFAITVTRDGETKEERTQCIFGGYNKLSPSHYAGESRLAGYDAGKGRWVLLLAQTIGQCPEKTESNSRFLRKMRE